MRDFLLSLIERHVVGRPVNPTPHVAVDECLNHPDIGGLVRQLMLEGRIDGSSPLWSQLRRREDGSLVSVQGGTPRVLPPGLDLGKPVKYSSDPDRKVVQLLLAHFASSDRLLLLSANSRLDHGGLRAPVLSEHRHDRLSLLFLLKKGKTSVPQYAERVGARLKDGWVSPGFEESRI